MSDPRYLKLNNIEAYKIAFNLSNFVWKKVITWDWFNKKTVGVQFVEAIDSISANIAEGFGRYHKKDKIKFYRYSQGSLKESFDWNEKSRVRNALTNEDYRYILKELQRLESAIYRLINFTNEKLKI